MTFQGSVADVVALVYHRRLGLHVCVVLVAPSPIVDAGDSGRQSGRPTGQAPTRRGLSTAIRAETSVS